MAHPVSIPSRLSLPLCVALALGGAGCRPMLFDEGVPKADIVIDGAAPAEVQKAASEISAYGTKTAGKAMRIRTPDQTVRAEGIDSTQSPRPGRGRRARSRTSDGYSIRTSGPGGHNHGRVAPRCALWRLRFHREVLGVRWFMPGGMGEDVAAPAPLLLPEINLGPGPGVPDVSGLMLAGGPGRPRPGSAGAGEVGPTALFGHNWWNIMPGTPRTGPNTRMVRPGQRGSGASSPALLRPPRRGTDDARGGAGVFRADPGPTPCSRSAPTTATDSAKD